MNNRVIPVGLARRVMTAVDGWQRRNRWAGVPYAVQKKFGDDNANLAVVALAWYGFTAIFPLLLVVITLFGFIGEQSIGYGVVNTLHQFPVVGSNFSTAGRGALHGSTLGLVVGLIGLLYGAQGVTQTAQQAMATVWNIPQTRLTGFFPRLGRSLAGLITIGAAFVVNAFVTGYATSGSTSSRSGSRSWRGCSRSTPCCISPASPCLQPKRSVRAACFPGRSSAPSRSPRSSPSAPG